MTPEQLALKKDLLRLRLAHYRMEIAADADVLRNPMRGAVIGGGIFKLLRSHPVLVSGASALLARVPRLGLAIRLAGALIAGWQLFKMVRMFRH